VKIIDLDLQRRRISLSIKQAAEGGVVAEEYREHFGEHAYDEQGNYIGPEVAAGFEPETEAQKAWAEEYAAQYGTDPAAAGPPEGGEAAPAAPAGPETASAAESPESPAAGEPPAAGAGEAENAVGSGPADTPGGDAPPAP
jgi:small subunit ribosomal protein S1